VRYVQAEFRKLLGLPSSWVAIGLGLLLAPAVVLINASYVRQALATGTLTGIYDIGYPELVVGAIGPIVLGVVAASSEYTSGGEHAPDARQVVTSLVAMPRRGRFLAAKATVVAALAAGTAVLSAIATTAAVHGVLGGAAPPFAPDRLAGVVVHWVLTALLACALTVCLRNGIVPMTVLILNGSVVSVAFLLSRLTDAAVLLPDVAGARMFVRDIDLPVLLPPVVGGLVMTAWVAALLGLGALVLRRRDA
jgi:ABC-2 type transport system permease protein